MIKIGQNPTKMIFSKFYIKSKIIAALVTLTKNQCISVALIGDSLSVDLTILAIMPIELILT